MWNGLDVKPESGRRIVATFNDGSGARLFMVHDEGLLDSDGDDVELNEGYDLWAYLPSDTRLWFELHEPR